MTDLTTAKEVVKETLLGTELDDGLELSAQTKATFEKNALKDAETGELFMTETEFINAVAPETEDYVSECLGQMKPIGRLTAYSTKSNASSTASCSRSQTGSRRARSISTTGASLKTCLRNPMPNTRSRFVSSTSSGRAPSSMRT